MTKKSNQSSHLKHLNQLIFGIFVWKMTEMIHQISKNMQINILNQLVMAALVLLLYFLKPYYT